MEKLTKLFTADELETMINDNVNYWANRLEGRQGSDIEGELANKLPHNQVAIAKQLLFLLRQHETLREAVKDYLQHPSEDGSPQRRPKRKRLEELVKAEAALDRYHRGEEKGVDS